MVTSLADVLQRIKSDVARYLEPEWIRQLCRQVGHVWRERVLDPVTTIHAFVLQVLYGNTGMEKVSGTFRGRKGVRNLYLTAEAVVGITTAWAGQIEPWRAGWCITC